MFSLMDNEKVTKSYVGINIERVFAMKKVIIVFISLCVIVSLNLYLNKTTPILPTDSKDETIVM